MAVNPYLDIVGDGNSCSQDCQLVCPTGPNDLIPSPTCTDLSCNNDGGDDGAISGCTAYSPLTFSLESQCEPNGAWAVGTCGYSVSGLSTSWDAFVQKQITMRMTYIGGGFAPSCVTFTVDFDGTAHHESSGIGPPSEGYVVGLFGAIDDHIALSPMDDHWHAVGTASFTLPLTNGVVTFPVGGYVIKLKGSAAHNEGWYVTATIVVS